MWNKLLPNEEPREVHNSVESFVSFVGQVPKATIYCVEWLNNNPDILFNCIFESVALWEPE